MVTARFAVTLLLFGALAPSARADDAGDVFKFFQEEANATTALRHPASTDRSPLAVDVITAADIKASGAVNLWDLLRFRVGMDVIEGRSSAGTDRAIVSVRGMPRDDVSELQVLIDGRSVYSPLSGGVLWEHLPVQIQDIERIEIVRGPNAALYGSNAGLGVINIITRKPTKPFEASATALGGSLDTRQGYASVEGATEKWGARVSAEDRAQDGFPKADGTGMANDWLHEQKANFRGWIAAGPGSTLELLAGVSREGHGKNVAMDPQENSVNHFQTAHLTHDFEGGSLLDARVSRTDDDTESRPGQLGTDAGSRYWQYDAEAFHSVPWAADRLRTTYGMAWRYAAATSNEVFAPDSGVHTNRTVRGFMHQEIKVTDSVSVLGGVSNETANAGGDHTDYQAAALWSPLPEQSFRAAYARANTKPGILQRDANITFPAGPGATGNVIGNNDLMPSPLTDYEAGWNGRFLERAVSVELTGYYMTVKNHLNVDTIPMIPPNVVSLQYDNTNLVLLRGLETGVKWGFAPGRSLYANYTRERVTDRDGHKLYLYTTPTNKFNAGADVSLPAGLRASFNAGWKDDYVADSNTGFAREPIGAFWRLDARLGWTPCSRLELFVAGQNLLAKNRREYVDGLSVPRTFYGGATVRY